jgi:hypothetical protein
MRVVKAYKYKLKTNAKSAAGCSATLDVRRELYNAALQERRDAYHRSKASRSTIAFRPSYFRQSTKSI